MMTPFEIRERVERIADAAPGFKAAGTLFLFRDVLKEIAKESPDPRSLAVEALKILER